MSSHYSKAQRPDQLGIWAREAAVTLEEHMHTTEGTPVLCYTGMSGVASATALSLELVARFLDFGMVYIRKSGEKSHGSAIEHSNVITRGPGVSLYGVFVDDFICTGASFTRVKQETNTWSAARCIPLVWDERSLFLGSQRCEALKLGLNGVFRDAV